MIVTSIQKHSVRHGSVKGQQDKHYFDPKCSSIDKISIKNIHAVIIRET